MADMEEIIQRISIEGAGDVGATLSGMVHDAESAFDGINKAAESGSHGLDLFGKGVVGIGLAVTAAAIGLGTMEDKLAATAVKLDDLGQAFGTTAGGLQGLEHAFHQLGVAPEQFERAIERTTAVAADSIAEIHRMQRTADMEAERAQEGKTGAAIAAQEAQNKANEVGTDQALKMRDDVISVADAYHNLQFAAQDAASTAANDMLSVQSAALGVRSAVLALNDAMADTGVQAAGIGLAGAQLSEAEARQHISDVESGHVDKAAQHDLQVRRAHQQLDAAELATKNAEHTKDTAPERHDLKVDEATNNLQKNLQALSDAMLKQQKDMTATSPVVKAQLQLDEALNKQTKDMSQSFLSVQEAGNALATALTAVKEAAEKEYDTKLKNLDLISRAEHGEDVGINLSDVTTGNKKLAAGAESEQTGKNQLAVLHDWFNTGAESQKGGIALTSQAMGLRRGQGAAEAYKAIKQTDIDATLKQGEKDKTNLQPQDTEKAHEVEQSSADMSDAAKKVALKIATAGDSLADALIKTQEKIATTVQKGMDNKVLEQEQKDAADELHQVTEMGGRAQSALAGVADNANDAAKALAAIVEAGKGGSGGHWRGGSISVPRFSGGGFVSATHGGGSIPGFADGGEVTQLYDKSGMASGIDWTGALAKIHDIIYDVADAAMKSQKAQDDARTEKHADGGHIRGPGSGTSDSILARLSNGEFVMRAAAVRAYGPDFMHRLNNMEMPGFAMGGLVPSRIGAPSPSQKGNGSVLNLSIDGHQFDGLHAPQDVAEKLTRYAISRQTAQVGRQPSWVK